MIPAYQQGRGEISDSTKENGEVVESVCGITGDDGDQDVSSDE
jgi:hypothetical protein